MEKVGKGIELNEKGWEGNWIEWKRLGREWNWMEKVRNGMELNGKGWEETGI